MAIALSGIVKLSLFATKNSHNSPLFLLNRRIWVKCLLIESRKKSKNFKILTFFVTKIAILKRFRLFKIEKYSFLAFLEQFHFEFVKSCRIFRKIKLEIHFFPILESQTIEDFGESLNLDRSDLEHLRSVFLAVENGDIGMLKSLGIKDSELGDVKFFLEKLVNTGFLD